MRNKAIKYSKLQIKTQYNDIVMLVLRTIKNDNNDQFIIDPFAMLK